MRNLDFVDLGDFQLLPDEETQFFDAYGWRISGFRSMLDKMQQLNQVKSLVRLWKPPAHWIYKESWQVFSQRVSVVLMKRRD